MGRATGHERRHRREWLHLVQPLAATPTQRQRSTARKRRDIRADPRRQLHQLSARDRVARERVDGVKRGRRQSLEPPPRPARTGMRFVSSMATPNRWPVASSAARAPRTARFSSGFPRSGAPAWTSSVTPRAVRRTTSSSASSSSTNAVSIWWWPLVSRARIRRNRLSFACAAMLTRSAGTFHSFTATTGRSSARRTCVRDSEYRPSRVIGMNPPMWYATA